MISWNFFLNLSRKPMSKRTIDKIGAASDFKGRHVRFDQEEVKLTTPDSPISNPSTNESDSDKEKFGRKPRKKSRVSLGSGGFAASETRGRTEVGPQVEHASAYVLFEELIYSALEDTKIKNGPQNLVNLFSCLPLSQTTIQEIQEKSQSAKEAITTEERKAATRSIRGSNYLANQSEYLTTLLQERLKGDCDEEEKQKIDQSLKGLERISTIDVASVKDALKLANRANFSSVVVDIMDDCIFGANKMPYASLPNEGVPPNPNTGRERTAKDNLKFLSDFLINISKANHLTQSEETEDQAKAAVIRDEIQHDQKMIKKLKDVWGLKSEDIQSLITGETNPNAIFDNVADKISEYVGHLFYYPRLDPTQMHEYEIDGVRSKWAVSEQEWNKVMAKDAASKAASKTPKYNQGTKPRNNDPEILYQLVGRHLVLAFNCFSGLGCFSVRQQESITDSFLQNSILEANGWNNEIVEVVEKKRKNVPIDTRYLGREVAKHATLNYQEQNFYTKDSYEAHQKQTSHNDELTI